MSKDLYNSICYVSLIFLTIDFDLFISFNRRIMLKGKHKVFLRGLANRLKPVSFVGKDGLTDVFLKQLGDVLIARELIKVSVLKTCSEDIDSIAEKTATASGADLVQVIGKKFVLYKPSEKKKRIVFPPDPE